MKKYISISVINIIFRIEINYFFENEDVRLYLRYIIFLLLDHIVFRHSNINVVHHVQGKLFDYFIKLI